MWRIKEKEIGQKFKYRRHVLKTYHSVFGNERCYNCHFSYKRRRGVDAVSCSKIFKCSKDERKDGCDIFYIRVN